MDGVELGRLGDNNEFRMKLEISIFAASLARLSLGPTNTPIGSASYISHKCSFINFITRLSLHIALG